MIRWVNISKAFGIISVVFAHSHAPHVYYQLFYYFHIPLFFFISGYLFNKEQVTFNLFLEKKIRAYLVPYYIYGFVFTILFIILLVLQNTLTMDKVITLFTGFILGQIDFMANKNMWFLHSLFITVIVAFLLFNLIKIQNSFLKTMMTISILFFLMNRFNGLENYFFSSTTIPASLLFLVFGYYYHEYEYYDQYINIYVIVSMVLLTVILYYFSYFNFHASLDIGNSRIQPSILLMMINALLGIFIIILISKFINHSTFLEYIGNMSLYIFMFHQVFTPLIDYFYELSGEKNIWIITGLLKISLSILLHNILIKRMKKMKIGKFL